ncbi:MAG: DUF4238 domain-containing protein, partial [Legionellales bacterium]|nr:DUF4238 domain-containing protein [Legionellales bacterium]
RDEKIDDINVVENLLAEGVESKAASAFKKLRNKNFPGSDEREKLSLFLGTLMVRTPGYLNHLQSQYDEELNLLLDLCARHKDGFYNGYKNAGIRCCEEKIEKDRQAILNNELDDVALLHRNALLRIMLNIGSIIAQHLSNMHWALVETNDQYPFITSDMIINLFHPDISLNGFYQPGLGANKSTLFVPISSQLTLMMVNLPDFVDGKIFTVNKDIYTCSGEKVDLKNLIKALNKTVYIKSYKYVFAGIKSEKLKRMFTNIFKQVKL